MGGLAHLGVLREEAHQLAGHHVVRPGVARHHAWRKKRKKRAKYFNTLKITRPEVFLTHFGTRILDAFIETLSKIRFSSSYKHKEYVHKLLLQCDFLFFDCFHVTVFVWRQIRFPYLLSCSELFCFDSGPSNKLHGHNKEYIRTVHKLQCDKTNWIFYFFQQSAYGTCTIPGVVGL